MSWHWLVILALGTACAAGGAVLGLVGEAAASLVGDAVAERPAVAARRRRYRPVMKAGLVAGLLSLTAAMMWVAIRGNGRPDSAAEARPFGLSAIALLFTAIGLLELWWWLAGRPRHH